MAPAKTPRPKAALHPSARFLSRVEKNTRHYDIIKQELKL